MSDPINIRALPPGTRIALADGAVAEIVSNPGGRRLAVRALSRIAARPSLVGQEEMIFAPDVVAVQPAG